MFKIGFGYDTHKLGSGGKLIIGGSVVKVGSDVA